MLPTYYRGCWHVVSRSFFFRYRNYRSCRKSFTPRRASSLTRRRCIRVSPIVQDSPLLPPVGVWPVFQCQCGRVPSQAGYRSKPWWAVTPPTSVIGRGPLAEPLARFPPRACALGDVCGISPGFPGLFPTPRQVIHVLLTRAPLYSWSCPHFLVRLACVRRAASVDSEPGSNSRRNSLSRPKSERTCEVCSPG